MNIIDLREYADDSSRIVSCTDKKILFMKNEEDGEGFGRVLYSCSNGTLHRINESRMPSCEGDNYTFFYDGENVLTYTFEEMEKKDICAVYRINVSSGYVEKLCSFTLKKDEIFRIKFINKRYFIAYGNTSHIDKDHTNMDSEISGEYEYAFLYDIDEDEKYDINDKRIIFSKSDNLFTYDTNSGEILFFEEYYLEDYKQEEMFKDKQKRSESFRSSYRESVNVIDLESFAESIKNGESNVPFTPIYKTEISGSTRYFGQDENNIYFRTKDFNINVETIYSVDKFSLQRKSVKELNENGMKFSKESTMWHDTENMKIYHIKIKGNTVFVKEILCNSLDINYEIRKGDFLGYIDNQYLITENYDINDGDVEMYIEVTDMKTNTSEKFKGSCEIYNNKLILL